MLQLGDSMDSFFWPYNYIQNDEIVCMRQGNQCTRYFAANEVAALNRNSEIACGVSKISRTEIWTSLRDIDSIILSTCAIHLASCD